MDCLGCDAGYFDVDLLFQRSVCRFWNNIYYLLIAVYGFVSWTRGSSKSKNGSLRITHIGWLTGVAAVCATLLLWWFIWWILVTFTDSTVPVADAFTTSLSIVGLWMLARKYVEQWLAWFVVDIVCCALYYYKGINFYCILYGIYTIVALLGFRKWLRMMKSQD